MPQNEAMIPHISRTLRVRNGDVRSRRFGVFGAAVLTICAIALPFSATAQKPAAKPTADLPSGAMQTKATTSCLECHEARIILQQRLSKPAWTREVEKMIKWGALVDANDRDALIDYLSTNFGPEQPPYDPPRSAVTAKK